MFLKIASGAQTGQVIPISSPLILGREEGDVLISDDSISNPHAEVEIHEGRRFLKDLESRNGIVCEGEKVSRLVLEEGVVFNLGSVQFIVQNEGEDQLDLSHAHAVSLEVNEGRFLEEELDNISDSAKKLVFLDHPIKLKFEKGIQKGVVWNISYLPRKIGSQDADLPLIYPELQNTGFELNLKKNKIIFSTYDQGLFLVNYKPVSEIELKDQDLIITDSSYIRVFIKK